MKKTIALVLALTLLLGALSGCGGDAAAPAAAETAAPEPDTAYLQTMPDLMNTARVITDVSVWNDQVYLRGAGDADGELFFKMSADHMSVEKLPITEPEGLLISDFAVCDEGIWLLCLDPDPRDTGRFTSMTASENGIMSVQNNVAMSDVDDTYYLKLVDETGAVLRSICLNELTDEDYLYFSELTVDADGDLALLQGGCPWYVGADGKLIFKDITQTTRLIRARDGRIYALSGSDELRQTLLDKAAGGVGDTLTSELTGDFFCAFSGISHDFYFSNGGDLWGCDVGGQPEKILNWVASDMDTSMMVAGAELSGGTLMALEWKETTEYPLTFLNPVDASQLPEKQTVTLAALYPSSDVRSMVVKFNRLSDKYRIEFKPYIENMDSVTDEEMTAAANQFSADMQAGTMADIVLLDDFAWEQFAAKGQFVDLEPLLRQSETVNYDDIIPNILEAMRTGETLYSIFPSFSVESYIGPASLAADGDWSYEDYVNALSAMPDDAVGVYGSNREDMLSSMVCLAAGNFIDEAAGTCDFVNQDFYDMLAFCASLPEKKGEEDYGVDWGTIEQEEYDAFKAGAALMREGYVMGLDMQVFEAKLLFDDYDYLGAPICGGQSYIFPDSRYGLYSGGNLEGGMAFIEFLLSESYQKGASGRYTLPVSETAMEDLVDSSIAASEGEETQLVGTREVQVEGVTEADGEKFMIMIHNLKYVSKSAEYIRIVYEEAGAYIAGDKTAQEVAEIIQNRVTLYLNENS